MVKRYKKKPGGTAGLEAGRQNQKSLKLNSPAALAKQIRALAGREITGAEMARLGWCMACGRRAAVLGVFIPDRVQQRFVYALCDHHFPASKELLLELEAKFFADPAVCSYVPTGGRA